MDYYQELAAKQAKEKEARQQAGNVAANGNGAALDADIQAHLAGSDQAFSQFAEADREDVPQQPGADQEQPDQEAQNPEVNTEADQEQTQNPEPNTEPKSRFREAWEKSAETVVSFVDNVIPKFTAWLHSSDSPEDYEASPKDRLYLVKSTYRYLSTIDLTISPFGEMVWSMTAVYGYNLVTGAFSKLKSRVFGRKKQQPPAQDQQPPDQAEKPADKKPCLWCGTKFKTGEGFPKTNSKNPEEIDRFCNRKCSVSHKNHARKGETRNVTKEQPVTDAQIISEE